MSDIFKKISDQLFLLQKLIFNTSILIAISIFAFCRNPGLLFRGNDGPTIFSLANEQLNYFGITTDLHSNLLEGIGNISLPGNLTVLPAYWYNAVTHNVNLSLALIYTWCAVQLFMSVLLIGWNHNFSSRVNYIAAWLLTILAFPYFESVRIYPMTASVPHFICIISIFALMDVGMNRMGFDGWIKSLFYTFILFMGLALGLIICPPALILLVPLLMFIAFYHFLKASTKNEKRNKYILMTFIIITAIAVGWFEFIAGILLNSAGVFFANDMHQSGVNTSLLAYSSILFHANLPGMKLGTWLFCASVLGSILAIFLNSRYKLLAIMILLAQVFIVGGGSFGMTFLPRYFDTVSPIYFEVLLWPFYALFSAYLLNEIIKLFPENLYTNKWITVFVIIVLSGIFFTSLVAHKPIVEMSPSYSIPPKNTAISDILENEIALTKGKVFSGRVASIIPNMNWMEQATYFSKAGAASGNDHQTIGLWLKQIPTLHEYSQTISPGFYRIYRRFLSVPLDHPYRSWSNFSKIDLKILRLLGVRFIISTLPEIKDTVLRTQVTFNSNIPSLYLFELKDINIAGISAKHIIFANSLPNAENIMAENNFSLNDAVLTEPVSIKDNDLTSSTISTLIIEKGGLHLQAKSSGKTLLILPIEYSHCIDVIPLSGETPKIIRVDLALTGVIFNQMVDVKIDNHTGPFHNPRCKLKDYLEFKQSWGIV